MSVVCKFELKRHGTTEIIADPNADILRVGMQGNKFYAWVRVDPDIAEEDKATLEIRVVATGETIENFGRCVYDYIGSITDATYEWHCFEITGVPDIAN